LHVILEENTSRIALVSLTIFGQVSFSEFPVCEILLSGNLLKGSMLEDLLIEDIAEADPTFDSDLCRQHF